MCELFHRVLHALITWAPPFTLVFSVFCCFGQSLRLWEAAQAFFPNLNAHMLHATAPDGRCRFYNTPPLSQLIWGYPRLNLKRNCYPGVNQWLHTQQHKQTIIRRKTQSLVTFYSLLLTCLPITFLLRGKACLSGWQNWQNILQPKTWAIWNYEACWLWQLQIQIATLNERINGQCVAPPSFLCPLHDNKVQEFSGLCPISE